MNHRSTRPPSNQIPWKERKQAKSEPAIVGGGGCGDGKLAVPI